MCVAVSLVQACSIEGLRQQALHFFSSSITVDAFALVEIFCGPSGICCLLVTLEKKGLYLQLETMPVLAISQLCKRRGKLNQYTGKRKYPPSPWSEKPFPTFHTISFRR